MKKLICSLKNQARKLNEDYAFRVELLNSALRELDEILEYLDDMTSSSEDIHRKFALAMLYLHDAKLFERFDDESKD